MGFTSFSPNHRSCSFQAHLSPANSDRHCHCHCHCQDSIAASRTSEGSQETIETRDSRVSGSELPHSSSPSNPPPVILHHLLHPPSYAAHFRPRNEPAHCIQIANRKTQLTREPRAESRESRMNEFQSCQDSIAASRISRGSQETIEIRDSRALGSEVPHSSSTIHPPPLPPPPLKQPISAQKTRL